MKLLPAGILLAGTLTLLAVSLSFAPPKAANGFAVVELFTSEGCSSCPAAEDLVAQIAAEQQDKAVYILAFHVDYWNRLGWKDPFSSPDFSFRQRHYRELLSIPTVYTPQLILNGKTVFKRSQEPLLRAAIQEGLQATPGGELTLSVLPAGDSALQVRYAYNGKTRRNNLLLTLVQRKAVSRITAGENNGRELTHINVVRKLENIDLKETSAGSYTIALPEGVTATGCDVIGFVQQSKTGEIIAAGKNH
ncbi:DUF1223 domain-containing protein [Chitinophaga sp. Mgbs1]|uniref:DUF1223 domain-containing protein n=1 Tax=Chitinophaga solisilvae TaxID=1233460 RepID=A0A433WEI9_9BACT|nr:DUF1223 domain-containing protein [Chitinophaga solisilvae]